MTWISVSCLPPSKRVLLADAPSQPCFAEIVVGARERVAQWSRIVAAWWQVASGLLHGDYIDPIKIPELNRAIKANSDRRTPGRLRKRILQALKDKFKSMAWENKIKPVNLLRRHVADLVELGGIGVVDFAKLLSVDCDSEKGSTDIQIAARRRSDRTGGWKGSRRRILVTAAFVPLGVELVRLVEEIIKLSFR